MSLTTTVTVHCDVCSHWHDGTHSMTARDALAAAKASGWTRPIHDGQRIDLCYRCTKAGLRP